MVNLEARTRSPAAGSSLAIRTSPLPSLPVSGSIKSFGSDRSTYLLFFFRHGTPMQRNSLRWLRNLPLLFTAGHAAGDPRL